MVRLSPQVTRSLNDYLDYLESEYGIRIEARDLSNSIHDNVERYQAEFDAMVLEFYDAVDKTEKKAFNICDSIEEDDPTNADERIDEVMEETRGKICEEGGKLARRLNSLNLRLSQRVSSSLLLSISNDVGQPVVEAFAVKLARFQFLTESVQDGTATSNEEREFMTYRREFFPEGRQPESDGFG
ncbi:MAG: hypothetical protein ABSB26_06340 [Nitrososphaerales archaeon]